MAKTLLLMDPDLVPGVGGVRAEVDLDVRRAAVLVPGGGQPLREDTPLQVLNGLVGPRAGEDRP